MTKTAARMLRLMDSAVRVWRLPVIGKAKGRVLRRLIATHQPRRGIEVGSLFGYSAILIAGHMPRGGHLVCVEQNPYLAKFVSANVEQAGLEKRREELVALGEKLSGQHRELIQLREGVKAWAAARQQEIEEQAQRLVQREIELDAQQEELRQARHIWHSERRGYERQIRELVCQLGATPAAA